MDRRKFDSNGNYISTKDVGVGDWQRIAYENLANAIIEKACDDYVRIGTSGLYDTFRKPSKIEITRFFHSQWFKELTNVNPDYLIRVLDQRIAEKRKKMGREPLEGTIKEVEEKELSVREKIQLYKEKKILEEQEKIFSRYETESKVRDSAKKMRGLWSDN